MREGLLALGLVVALIALAAVSQLFAFGALLGTGAVLVVLGLVVGLPAAIVYHARLAAVLEARDALPPRWYWHPTRLHASLEDDERPDVMPWFLVGAGGWCAVIAGCVLAVIGALRLS